MSDSSIEWTDTTWNPTTGCDRVSPGCDNCYALTMARRLKGMGAEKYQNDGDPKTSGPGFGITKHPDTLALPLTWRKPRRVFVNSMSDLFHDGVSSAFIAQVFDVMRQTPQHTYQILTKRHARMRSLLRGAVPGEGWPLPNVWLGVSVDDQKRADLRIPALLDTPAAVRFLSCEPLLGPVDLGPWLECPHDSAIGLDGQKPALDSPVFRWRCDQCDTVFDNTGQTIHPGLSWVIVGGESGPGARPMELDWARQIVQQCQAAQVPVFVKQLGKAFTGSGKGGDMDAWPADLRVREFPQALTRAAS